MLALIFEKKRFKNINVSVSGVAKVVMDDRRAFWDGAPKQTSTCLLHVLRDRRQQRQPASLGPGLLFRNFL